MEKIKTKEMRKSRSGISLLFLHAVCYLLVVLYVNMFQFWAWLSKILGHGILAKILPILVTVAVLLVIAYRFVERVNKGYEIKFVFLGLGIVTAFLALAIPDPGVPIKRIHVAEYILLSFMVRYVLSFRLQGSSLLVFTVVVTALYGVHDEMLQGLHSLRYYGWRDMTVNAMAGLSGALLGHGLISFTRSDDEHLFQIEQSYTIGSVALFVVLSGSVFWQIFYLYHHRTGIDVLLAVLPVILSSVVIAGASKEIIVSSSRHHGMQTAYWLALGLVVYPLVSLVTGIEFR